MEMFQTPIDHPFQIYHPIAQILGIICFLVASGIKYNAYKRQNMNPILGLLCNKGGQPYHSTKERIIGSALLGAALVSMSFSFVSEINPDRIIERVGIFVMVFVFTYFTIFHARKV